MFNGLSFLNKDESEFRGFLSGAASNEKSNLADIFEADDETAKAVNAMLRYSSQMQKPQPDKATWNVVIAKIVGAFKLLNDENQALGHLGLAILNKPVDDASKLILYKTKDKVLSTLLLEKSSKVYWNPPYLQYHDDMRGFWSMNFSNNADSEEFLAKLKPLCSLQREVITEPEEDLTKGKEPEKDNETEKVSKAIPPKPSEEKEPANDKVDGTETTDKSATKAKSDVVYRVAKIGHQLPKIRPAADDDSDSTIPSDVERVPSVQPLKFVHNKIPDKLTALVPSHLPPKPANISVAFQPPFWQSSSSSSSTFDLNAFAAENRIQNTEVRMNISKLDSKLDRVLDNIERLRLSSSNATEKPDEEAEIIKLEEKMLELKKENRLLKMQLAESEQVKRMADDKEKEELAELMKIKEEKELKITELTIKLEDAEKTMQTVLNSKEKETALKITELTTKCKDTEEHFHAVIGAKEKENSELSMQLEELRKKVEKEAEKAAEVPEQSKKVNANNGETIRNIMNQFYVKLYQSIDGKEAMASADILKLTAEIIRKETKAALNSN